MMPLLSSSQYLPVPKKAYETAFNYIKRDRKHCRMEFNLRDVAVFDSIVHKDLTWFNQDLGALWGYKGYQKEGRLVDSLYQLGIATFHKPYFSFSQTLLLTLNGPLNYKSWFCKGLHGNRVFAAGQ
ncbi:hypothetical protein [Hymenobacter amundsenii]|nr:hypothetical protein [Hymenobacter amundsenii]